MEALEVTVKDCVRYRKQVMVGCMPEPPRAWSSLDFDRVEAELATLDWGGSPVSPLWTYHLHYLDWAVDLAWARISGFLDHFMEDDE